MQSYERLLAENKIWAKEKLAADPEYFNRLVHVQNPEFLWIGCSDSRVPANEITCTQPGEIFVHREEVDVIKDEKAQLNRMVELNVQEQVLNLAKTSIIQKAWKERNTPHLHGWVYDLQDGLIKPIQEMQAGTHIDNLYEFDDL
ncbi:MAG: hypothetical protein RI983_595 [Bacteroidota bacterium]|jgi:carbonic anhydrase